MKKIGCLFVLVLCLFGCKYKTTTKDKKAHQWQEMELVFHSNRVYENPYTDVEMYVEFDLPPFKLKREAFWDGKNTWKVRFASPVADGTWNWTSYCSDSANQGLHLKQGKIQCKPYTGQNVLLKNGLLKMSKAGRNVVHASGKSFLVVGDTPWAIPFRGTVESVKKYAKDRQEKGFNTVLLMSVQPDMNAKGPRDRVSPQGFDVGFEDLPEGHLNKMNIRYFQYLDSLMDILIDHELVPAINPVFQGFGWKGEDVLGDEADPGEYARYTRYLVARYGARPAMWLVSADGSGLDACVKPAGEMVEKWDCYGQPTGIHYNPCDDFIPDWGDSVKCLHYNKSYQDEPWLDFQWCQTGHDGEHKYDAVAEMYENRPVKAVLNGEPTYEGMGGGTLGLARWQSEEAWGNLMAGGTMGVVYGAASLWQWKLYDDEAGWTSWSEQPLNWEKAMKLPGSKYVGHVGIALDGLDIADIEKRPDLAGGKPCLAKEGELYISYLQEGGKIRLKKVQAPARFQWFDPVEGFVHVNDTMHTIDTLFEAPDESPWVLIVEKIND